MGFDAMTGRNFAAGSTTPQPKHGMDARKALELALEARAGIIQHSNYALAASVEFTLEAWINERTTVEWRRSYIKAMLVVMTHAPFGSDLYHFAWQELERDLDEIDSEPSDNSIVGVTRKFATQPMEDFR